jgi:hypothetical protein
MTNPRIFSLLTILVILVASTAVAQEQAEPRDTRVLDDRISIRLIGGLVDFSTDVAAGRSLGALIDLEDVLGFDESIGTIGIQGHWRISRNRKHALHLRFGDFNRDAYKNVEGTVPILDLEFFGELASRFVNQVGSIEYQYSFINHHKTEAGMTAGFGIYRYELELEGQVMVVDGSGEDSEFRKESVGVVAPVPAFGFYINQALRPDLIFEIRTSFIDLELGEHNGRIFSSWGSLTWYFSRHIGVGIGVSASDVVYERNASKEKIKVELRRSAANLSLSVVF